MTPSAFDTAARRCRTVAAVALMTGLVFSAQGAFAQALSLGEQYALRAYTGQAIGKTLTESLKLKSLGIATNPSSICASLTGAIATEVVGRNRDNGALAVQALAKPDDAASSVAALTKQEGVALVFGGQMSLDENAALVKATLAELARSNYAGPLFLHVRVWAPRLAARAAAEDAAIAAYLSAKQNVYTVTVDPQAAKVLVHQVKVQAGEQQSVKVLQDMPMVEPWLALFRRSI
jgi:hypothetical protein